MAQGPAPNYVSLLQQVGFPTQSIPTAMAIIKRESGGNPQAFNPNRKTGDESYGLFQINMLGKLGPARLQHFGLQNKSQLFDPVANAKAAYILSKGGTDFGPWGVGPNAYRNVPLNVGAGQASTPYTGGATAAPSSMPAPQMQAPQIRDSLPGALAIINSLGANKLGAETPSALPMLGALLHTQQQPSVQSVQQPGPVAASPPTPQGTGGAAAPGQLSPGIVGVAKSFGLNVTSGYRSVAKQAELYANRSTSGSVAAPGKSYHNSGRAIDVAVNEQSMAFLKYAFAHPQQFAEVFYDPAGEYIKNGQIVKGSIGGHSDHVHIAR